MQPFGGRTGRIGGGSVGHAPVGVSGRRRWTGRLISVSSRIGTGTSEPQNPENDGGWEKLIWR